MIIHITGITTFLKTEFIQTVQKMNFDVFDMDTLSKNILFSSNKQHGMGRIWKNKMINELKTFFSNNTNKNIIIIGLNFFILDRRYKINFDTIHKYFLDIPYKSCASQLIMYNIDKYRMDIIQGDFPLKYLDMNFLINQRKELQTEYLAMKYMLRTYDELFNELSKIQPSQPSHPIHLNNKQTVYLAFFKRFDNDIPMTYIGSNPILFGYKEKWMAVASLLPKNYIKRGLLQNEYKIEPYIKELHLKAFDGFKKPSYLYEFNSIGPIDEYRSKISNLKFVNRYYISNVFNELVQYGVVMEEFKFAK